MRDQSIADQLTRLESQELDVVIATLVEIGKQGVEELEPVVASFLQHNDAEIRAAAIRTLAFYWQLPGYKDLAGRLAKEDPDEDVRAAALMSWSVYYRETADSEVMQHLYELLIDESEEEAVRAQAYPSLLAVSKLPRPEWPQRLSIYGDIDAAVDWDIVRLIMNSLG